MKYKPETSIPLNISLSLSLGYGLNVSSGLLRGREVPRHPIMSDLQPGWMEQAQPDLLHASKLAAAVPEGSTCSGSLGGVLGEDGDGHDVHLDPLKLPRQDSDTVSVVMQRSYDGARPLACLRFRSWNTMRTIQW